MPRAALYLQKLIADYMVRLNPGTDPSRPTYVAIKGTIFDVSKNAAYAPGGQYHGKHILPSPPISSSQIWC
jgi:hypothetical protein